MIDHLAVRDALAPPGGVLHNDRSAFEAYSGRVSTRRMGDALDAALVRVEVRRMAHDA